MDYHNFIPIFIRQVFLNLCDSVIFHISQESKYNASLEEYKQTISQHENKIENFYEQVKQLKDAIMERTEEMDGMKAELDERKRKCDEQIESILKEVNTSGEVGWSGAVKY